VQHRSLLAFALAFGLAPCLAAACGDGRGAPDGDTTGPDAYDNGCPAVDDARWTYPEPIPTGDLLPDPGFEGAIGSTPVGWDHVEFGGASYQAGAESALVHGGAQAYWYRRTGSGGGARLVSTPAFALDHTYEVRLFARADTPARVTVAVMSTLAGIPEEQKTVTVGPDGWTEITLHVVYPKPTVGSLWIVLLDAGPRFIFDDVTVRDVSAPPDYAPVVSTEIAPTQIGIHVNKWGLHQTEPDAGQGLIRFHDTGTTWRDLEPADDAFAFTRLDFLLGKVDGLSVRPDVLFELGQTPAWAALDPTLAGSYGLGAPSPPADVADFGDYVREVATTEAGRIQAWELWNEYNQPEFWRGTHEQMVALTARTRAVLDDVDPAAIVLSPSVTVSRIVDIVSFLGAGGGQHVDVIAFHAYFGLAPERLRSIIRNVRRMVAEAGLSLPVWNTEGGLACDPIAMDCSAFDPEDAPTDGEIRGAIARALIVQRAEGVESFAYYLWDRYRPNPDGTSGEPANWTVNASLVHQDFITPTVSGVAFRVVAGWLVGGRLAGGWRRADGTFVYELARSDGRGGYLAWNPDGDVTLPIAPSWRVAAAHHTDGTSSSVDGCSVTVGRDPVLLGETW
jgi:hypothetical protein